MYSLILCGRRSCIIERNFKTLVNLWQNFNFFSSASAANVRPRDLRKGKTFTVSYLVDSLGLSTKVAESISSKISFEDKGNPDSVLNLFRSHGFTDSQISSIITDNPRLLISNAEKTLGPKLQVLHSRGASTSELTEIVSAFPKILGRREGKSISLYYDFVRDVLRDKEETDTIDMNRNVLALRKSGVPQELLSLLLNSSYGLPVYGKDKFEESVKKVVEMGFDPTTPKFVKALRTVYALKNETIEEKVSVYKRLGLAEGDVWAMFKKWPISLTHSEKKITLKFETLKECGLLEDEICSVFKKFPQFIGTSEQKIENSIETLLGLGVSKNELTTMIKRHPACIKYSAESVKKKTEFLVKEMNWPLKDVALYPQVISYSMEKRIVPRCNVIKALFSKGLLSELPRMLSVLICTDQVFLNKYVRKHDDKGIVAELMAIFTGNKRKTNKACE